MERLMWMGWMDEGSGVHPQGGKGWGPSLAFGSLRMTRWERGQCAGWKRMGFFALRAQNDERGEVLRMTKKKGRFSE